MENRSSARSKLIVIGFVGLIVLGAVAWNTWDYLGTEGLNPKKVTAMAKDYEVICYKRYDHIKGCKRHIGRRQTACIKQGIDRHDPKTEPPRPIRYDKQAYEACMLAHLPGDMAQQEIPPVTPAPTGP